MPGRIMRMAFIGSCLSLAILGPGCATDKPASASGQAPANSERMQDRLRLLEENNPVVHASAGGLSYVIRMQNAADIPEDAYDNWFWMSGEGAAALLIGQALNPMFAGAVFLGGAIILPGSIIGYLHDKSVWESIASAMSTFPFTQSVEQSLVRRL